MPRPTPAPDRAWCAPPWTSTAPAGRGPWYWPAAAVAPGSRLKTSEPGLRRCPAGRRAGGTGAGRGARETAGGAGAGPSGSTAWAPSARTVHPGRPCAWGEGGAKTHPGPATPGRGEGPTRHPTPQHLRARTRGGPRDPERAEGRQWGTRSGPVAPLPYPRTPGSDTRGAVTAPPARLASGPAPSPGSRSPARPQSPRPRARDVRRTAHRSSRRSGRGGSCTSASTSTCSRAWAAPWPRSHSSPSGAAAPPAHGSRRRGSRHPRTGGGGGPLTHAVCQASVPQDPDMAPESRDEMPR